MKLRNQSCQLILGHYTPSLVKLYRHNGKYYLQSPCIVDKKGRANVKVACEKLKASN